MADHKAIIKEMLETFWRPNVEPDVARYFTPDFRNHDPGRPEIVDRDSLRGYVEDLAVLCPDYRIEALGLIEEGDFVSNRWVFRGTLSGPTDDEGPGSGPSIEVTGQTVYRFENDLIAECWGNDDQLSLMRQLGMELRPA
jgi:predicted ester cyclase